MTCCPLPFPSALKTTRNFSPDSMWTGYKIRNIPLEKSSAHFLYATALNYKLHKTCCHSSKIPTLPSFLTAALQCKAKPSEGITYKIRLSKNYDSKILAEPELHKRAGKQLYGIKNYCKKS